MHHSRRRAGSRSTGTGQIVVIPCLCGRAEIYFCRGTHEDPSGDVQDVVI
jgi:hypothetical protein